MNNNQVLIDLQGVLFKLVELSNDQEDIEFLHDLIDKIKIKIKGDKK